MKKLMIAAAIVCAAVVTQAASFTWGFASDMIVGPKDSYNVEGYLNGEGVIATLYVSDGASGWTEIATATQDPNTYQFGSLDPSSPASSELVNAVTSLSDATQKFKMILETADQKYYLESIGNAEVVEVVGMGSSTFMQSYQNATLGNSAGDWKAAEDPEEPIPEPTSGLLLVLGLAGLALKRKHA